MTKSEQDLFSWHIEGKTNFTEDLLNTIVAGHHTKFHCVSSEDVAAASPGQLQYPLTALLHTIKRGTDAQLNQLLAKCNREMLEFSCQYERLAEGAYNFQYSLPFHELEGTRSFVDGCPCLVKKFALRDIYHDAISLIIRLRPEFLPPLLSRSDAAGQPLINPDRKIKLAKDVKQQELFECYAPFLQFIEHSLLTYIIHCDFQRGERGYKLLKQCLESFSGIFAPKLNESICYVAVAPRELKHKFYHTPFTYAVSLKDKVSAKSLLEAKGSDDNWLLDCNAPFLVREYAMKLRNGGALTGGVEAHESSTDYGKIYATVLTSCTCNTIRVEGLSLSSKNHFPSDSVIQAMYTVQVNRYTNSKKQRDRVKFAKWVVKYILKFENRIELYTPYLAVTQTTSAGGYNRYLTPVTAILLDKYFSDGKLKRQALTMAAKSSQLNFVYIRGESWAGTGPNPSMRTYYDSIPSLILKYALVNHFKDIFTVCSTEADINATFLRQEKTSLEFSSKNYNTLVALCCERMAYDRFILKRFLLVAKEYGKKAEWNRLFLYAETEESDNVCRRYYATPLVAMLFMSYSHFLHLPSVFRPDTVELFKESNFDIHEPIQFRGIKTKEHSGMVLTQALLEMNFYAALRFSVSLCDEEDFQKALKVRRGHKNNLLDAMLRAIRYYYPGWKPYIDGYNKTPSRHSKIWKLLEPFGFVLDANVEKIKAVNAHCEKCGEVARHKRSQAMFNIDCLNPLGDLPPEIKEMIRSFVKDVENIFLSRIDAKGRVPLERFPGEYSMPGGSRRLDWPVANVVDMDAYREQGLQHHQLIQQRIGQFVVLKIQAWRFYCGTDSVLYQNYCKLSECERRMIIQRLSEIYTRANIFLPNEQGRIGLAPQAKQQLMKSILDANAIVEPDIKCFVAAILDCKNPLTKSVRCSTASDTAAAKIILSFWKNKLTLPPIMWRERRHMIEVFLSTKDLPGQTMLAESEISQAMDTRADDEASSAVVDTNASADVRKKHLHFINTVKAMLDKNPSMSLNWPTLQMIWDEAFPPPPQGCLYPYFE